MTACTDVPTVIGLKERLGDQRVSVRTRRALVGSFAGLSLSAGGVAAIWGLMSGINAVRQAGGIVSVHCMAVSGKLPFSVSRGSDISVAGALYGVGQPPPGGELDRHRAADLAR